MDIDLNPDWEAILHDMARPSLRRFAEDIAIDIRTTIEDEHLIDSGAMLASVDVVEVPEIGVTVGTSSTTSNVYTYVRDGQTYEISHYWGFLEFGTDHIPEHAFIRRNLYKRRNL